MSKTDLFIEDICLNLSSKSINERNFDTLIQGLTIVNCRINTLNLSYNAFFKDQSLMSLIQYLEKKSLDMISNECSLIFTKAVLIHLK